MFLTKMSDTLKEIKPDRQWTWEQWMKGRYQRRMAGLKVAPAVILRAESKDDLHLREANNGERGPKFASNEDLRKIAEDLGGPLS